MGTGSPAFQPLGGRPTGSHLAFQWPLSSVADGLDSRQTGQWHEPVGPWETRPAPSGERALGPRGKAPAGLEPYCVASHPPSPWQAWPRLRAERRRGDAGVPVGCPARGLGDILHLAERPKGPLPRGGGSHLPRPPRLVPLPGLRHGVHVDSWGAHLPPQPLRAFRAMPPTRARPGPCEFPYYCVRMVLLELAPCRAQRLGDSGAGARLARGDGARDGARSSGDAR